MFFSYFMKSQSRVKVNALTLTLIFFSKYFSKFLKYLLLYISIISIDYIVYSFLRDPHWTYVDRVNSFNKKSTVLSVDSTWSHHYTWFLIFKSLWVQNYKYWLTNNRVFQQPYVSSLITPYDVTSPAHENKSK